MSKRIKMLLPIPMPDVAIDIFKEQMPPEMSRPDISYEWFGTKNGANILDSYYDAVLSDAFVMEAGARAEEEGYDAVCINSMSDSGLKGLRSRLSIPVFGPGHSSFLAACMLGKQFSIITMWDQWHHMYEKTLKDEELTQRCASIRSIGVRPDTQELMSGKEDSIFPLLEEQGRHAVEEDGADVLILGSTTMHQSHAYLAEKLPVPVINPGVVAFKLCEMFLDLGLSHSKTAYPSPEKTNDTVFDTVPGVF